MAGSAEDPSGFGSVADRGQLLTPPLGSHPPALSTAFVRWLFPLFRSSHTFAFLDDELFVFIVLGARKSAMLDLLPCRLVGRVLEASALNTEPEKSGGRSPRTPAGPDSPEPSYLLPKETCSVPRASAPTLPDTPVTSGPWYLGTATELGRVGGLFLNKVPAQSWGFFKFKKKESYSVLHLFTVQYIFLTFPVIFEMKPSCVLS